MNREQGSLNDLIGTFRSSLGFAAVSKDVTEVPLQYRTDSGATGTRFISGYVELLLTGGPE